MGFYSIGEVANMLDIPASTLRYYDREGLLLHVKRSNGGIRIFTDTEVGTLKVIECLKSAGLQIKEIKQFLDWSLEGDETLQKRRDMFYERKAVVEKELENIQRTLDIIQYKCWYYDTALEAGGEEALKNIPVDDLPKYARKGKQALENDLSKE